MKLQTTSARPTGITAALGTPCIADVTSEQTQSLMAADQMSNVELELRDLQDSFGTEWLKAKFPEKDLFTGEPLGSMEEQCKAMKAHVAEILLEFAQNPTAGSSGLLKWQNLLEQGLQASMVGPVIERIPAYTPFKTLVLMQAAPKRYEDTQNGLDPLEYEDPIEVGEAYNFVPESTGPVVVEVTGNRTTISPYFKITPRHALTFSEWTRRQIKPIVIKKRQLQQELNIGWDNDLVTHFDAVVPDGTLYSSHNSHIISITNNANQVTRAKFLEGSLRIRHTDAATGTIHIAPPGFALCDPLAIDDIRNWGTDVWTEEEVSDFAKRGFGQRWDETLNVGKKLDEYSLLQTPIRLAQNNRRVRFFAVRERVGYFIPVTVNNRRTHVTIGPTVGNDPDVGRVRDVTTPPGYTFTMEAWEGGAIQIINHFGLGKLNHA